MVSDDSFLEDPLRMLRAVQFAARFEFRIEDKTCVALKKHADLMASISPERINEELNKLLLLADKPSFGFRLMQDYGLMKHVFPELAEAVGVNQPGGFHKYDVFEHSLYTADVAPKKLSLRLAALLHDIAKPQTKKELENKATFYGHEAIGARRAAKRLKQLRYPTDVIREVKILIERHMFTVEVTDKGLRRLIRRVGQELIFDLLDLRRADVVAQGMGGTTTDVDEFEQRIKDELERRPPFGYGDLALNGHDIMDMFDIPESREVGEILEHLMEKVLDEPDDNTREKLSGYARTYWNEQIKNKNK
jgi:putative nucleotidyltransferase with HDIG domain